ncbi:MAG: LLM class flavin-dependent oxidoreductase [Saprospiraceae bacterium]|nr:LLM class flavin-dependent oxidoreductase [Saprospiraceae bacterium]
MEIGVDTFAAVPSQGETLRHDDNAQALAELLQRIELADKVGIDVFGMGEHYRKEFLDSAPAIILAAAAARTQRIKLRSAVTVLSAADSIDWIQSDTFNQRTDLNIGPNNISSKPEIYQDVSLIKKLV